VKGFLSVIIAFFVTMSAHAQTIGATLDFAGVNQPWPVTGQYQPFLPHNVRTNNLPGGATGQSLANNSADVAFVAPRAGWVQFSGQVWIVLDWNSTPPTNGSAVLRIFKNGSPGVCADAPGQRPLIPEIGLAGDGFWWTYKVAISDADLAKAGDSYSFCLYVVAPDSSNYIDGVHTRITVTELP